MNDIYWKKVLKSPPLQSKNNVLIYPLRKEASLSGEKKTYETLKKFLSNSNHHLLELKTDGLQISHFIKFFSLERFTQLNKISQTQEIDTLIVKIPTSAQIFLALFLCRHFKGELLIWIDGMLWKTPPPLLFIKFLIKEPIMTLARMILNNSLWNKFYFKKPVKYIASSQLQLDFHNYSKNSEKCVIANTHIFPSKKQMTKSKNDKMTFGYIGHTYYCKGVEHLLNSIKILKSQGHQFQLKVAFSGRGNNALKSKALHAGAEVLGKVDLESFYNSIDYLIAPYQVTWGTNIYPSILIESLYYEVPVIAPQNSVCLDFFKSESAFIGYDCNDHNKLRHLIEDLVLQKRIFKNKNLLKQIYNTHYSPDIIKAKWLKILSHKLEDS